MSGCAKSRDLEALLAAEIAANGPITVARFVELALYHPHCGYYARDSVRIGRSGDYLTSVSVGETLGRVLAAQCSEVWEALGKPDEWVLVEQGAHDGRLAADLAAWLPPDVAARTHLWIVEPLAALETAQREALATARVKTSWFRKLADLPSFVGVFYSNELVDAFPFHLMVATRTGWLERHVILAEGKLGFEDLKPSEAVNHYNLPPREPGTLCELRPSAETWVRDLSQKLARGILLTIDYGRDRTSLRAPHRTRGTFLCYRGHLRDDDFLSEVGEKDITAHVDFTALAQAGVASGLRIAGFVDQHRFLVGAAEAILRGADCDPAFVRQFKTLMHPESMGSQFRVLGMTRGLDRSLSGFRHARVSDIDDLLEG